MCTSITTANQQDKKQRCGLLYPRHQVPDAEKVALEWTEALTKSGGAVHEASPPHSPTGVVAKMTASTVAQYLAALNAVRKALNENLPDGYEEGMQFCGFFYLVSLPT